LLPDFNQALNVLVPNGTSKGGTVQFLGTFPPTTSGTADCAAVCIKHPERCWSFVHMTGGADPALVGQCFAVTSPGFNPSYDPAAVSGIVAWGCRSDDDVRAHCRSSRRLNPGRRGSSIETTVLG
jgi:hypothetical protein